jgi:hypothetical protein
MRRGRVLPVVAKPAVAKIEVQLDVSAAKLELNVAWEQYKQSTIKHYHHGIEFGQVCYDWRTRYKAQGSRSGKGFDHLLEQIGIPKTTAYRWIRLYETRNGLRARRNEVEDNDLKIDVDATCNIPSAERRTSFHFLLTEERRHKFEQDVDTLGGHKRVAEMFLEFVSEKAFEKRKTSVANRKSAWPDGSMRRTA